MIVSAALDFLCFRHFQSDRLLCGASWPIMAVTSNAPAQNRAAKCDVFLSYAGDDRKEADLVVAELVGLRVSYWNFREHSESGASIPEEISTQITHCKLFVALISDHYFKAGYTR